MADALLAVKHSRPSTPNPQAVEAYAKLQGEDFVFYIQTLSVILGRRSSPSDEVHVDLGRSKVISRKHARIEYNFIARRFEISCFGKNGMFVDGKAYGPTSEPVPLETK